MMKFDVTLLIQFLNILILMILFNFFLFKPVLRVLDKRQKTISSLFDKVENIKTDTVGLEKSYDEQAKEKKRPILEYRDSSMSQAHSVSTGIIEKARKDLSDELTRVKSQIEGESKKVREALMADVEKLAGEAAEKILRRSL
ncbi:MAG: ATP synthase F0 subunit B [Syntrophobacterales bacterium]|jgi:F-type H+-transporting ATPase subunit b|nr:ATP synthase F0 subunit B [Syntrophobacterales bacterium]